MWDLVCVILSWGDNYICYLLFVIICQYRCIRRAGIRYDSYTNSLKERGKRERGRVRGEEKRGTLSALYHQSYKTHLTNNECRSAYTNPHIFT